jgi:hypothetical protein
VRNVLEWLTGLWDKKKLSSLHALNMLFISALGEENMDKGQTYP